MCEDERTKIESEDLIGLIQREQARYIASGENRKNIPNDRIAAHAIARELGYILGRCTAHAEHIRPIQARGD